MVFLGENAHEHCPGSMVAASMLSQSGQATSSSQTEYQKTRHFRKHEGVEGGVGGGTKQMKRKENASLGEHQSCSMHSTCQQFSRVLCVDTPIHQLAGG